MGIVSLLLTFFFLLSVPLISDCRETLEIGIGVGGGGGGGGIGFCIGGFCPLLAPPPPPEILCPPPPPPPEPVCPPPPPPPPRRTNRAKRLLPIIMKFKNSILKDPNGDPNGITKTWTGKDPCNFKGFYCATPPDDKFSTALAAIDFNGYRLKAPSLEGFVDLLPDLAFFHANSNNFSGRFPAALAKLPYLYEFDISNNKFTGSFPFEVLKLKNLTFLDIRFNSFQGFIPQELFFSFKILEVLFINNNNLMQPLPSNLGQTPVKYLTLANNQFTGSIPKSIGQAKDTLLEVLFLNNKLSGCLPYEIGYLKKATVFDAGSNQITGPIPYSFGCLYKVEQLNLAGNLLYGPIPEVVCSLGNLLNLSLSDNYLTEAGPQCRKLIKKGRLDTKKNCILGLPNQRKAEDCNRFFSKAMHWQCSDSKQMYKKLPCAGKYQAGAVSSPFSSAILPSPAPSPSYSALIHNR